MHKEPEHITYTFSAKITSKKQWITRKPDKKIWMEWDWDDHASLNLNHPPKQSVRLTLSRKDLLKLAATPKAKKGRQWIAKKNMVWVWREPDGISALVFPKIRIVKKPCRRTSPPKSRTRTEASMFALMFSEQKFRKLADAATKMLRNPPKTVFTKGRYI